MVAPVEELLRVKAEIARLEARADELKAELRAQALEMYDATGAAQTWRLKGLGNIGLVVPEPRAQVSDERALTGFVAERIPEAIETITRVRPEDLNGLLTIWNRVAATGALVTDDGEVVPGVVLAQPPAYLRVVLAKEAKAPVG